MTSVNPSRPVLEIDGLCVVAERRNERIPLLTDVSLTVDESEVVGIVGESGSGKSTLARSVTRLLPSSLSITAGSVRLNGKDILHAPPSSVHRLRPGGLSMVFQSPMTALNPLMTIGRQVSEAFEYLSVHRREAIERSVNILERMGIKDASARLDDYPYQFSGGQRQRIVIAIALASRPSVLIADEPTSALDVTTQAAILEMFAEIARDNATAIIFVSHNYAVVSSVCSRVMVLYSGRVMELGPAEALLSSPRHPYTAALITSLPSVERRVDTLHVIPGSPPQPGQFINGCPFRERCEYVRDGCATAAIPLRPIGPGHWSACIRVGEIWDSVSGQRTTGNPSPASLPNEGGEASHEFGRSVHPGPRS